MSKGLDRKKDGKKKPARTLLRPLTGAIPR